LLVLIGLPVILLGFQALRGYGRLERRRIARLTGDQIVTPYRELPSGRMTTKLMGHISDPATWRDGLHLAVSSVLGLGWFVAAVGIWGLTLSSLSLPFWYQHLWHHRVPIAGGYGQMVYVSTTPSIVLLCVLTLIFTWFVSPPLLELATRIQTGLGKGLLGLSRTELELREASLRVSRGQAVSAAETERRRIERDLHDGAQQRLVALAMDLGMAKSKLKSGADVDTADTEAAAKLVAEAHEGVKLALAELRDLARGIHPAVLTDRGLDAALSALAARSPIPVEVEAALTWRPSPEVESAAYFVASEALANMAKHASATRAWIELDHSGGALRMVVGDDGVGGAVAGTGTGLSGLADRVAPLDGILSVSSPIGGPTLIVMEIPCQPPLGY
jgi:signal transduction histidine kinase